MTRAVAVSWRRLAEPAQTVVPNATAKDHSCGVNLLSSIYRQRPPRCQQDLNDKQHDTHPNPDTTFPFHAVRAKRRPLPSRPGDGRRHRRSLAPRSVNGLPTGHVHEQPRRVPPVAGIPDSKPVGSDLAPSRTTEMDSRPRWVGPLFPKLFPKPISGLAATARRKSSTRHTSGRAITPLIRGIRHSQRWPARRDSKLHASNRCGSSNGLTPWSRSPLLTHFPKLITFTNIAHFFHISKSLV